MFLIALVAALLPFQLAAQQGPLRIEITEGVIEPLPVAVAPFLAEDPGAARFAADISRVIGENLAGTGLFRQIPQDAYISTISNFEAPVQYPDWKAINAQALITGSVAVGAGGRLIVKFRLFDVFSEAPLGDGLQFAGETGNWRRMAHKVSDQVYSRITGEAGYFDSRVAFVSETGPKNAREKRIAVMDYDGANVSFLTDASAIVLAPRFSPQGDRLIYTSYETGFPAIYELNVASAQKRRLSVPADEMSFAPRYAPNGQTAVFSLTQGGNTDIHVLDLAGGQSRQLTSSPSIETAPSFSPDGSRIVFESDRSGSQQIYIMNADGSDQQRISFGQGRYGAPVWSPRGDLVAFTKQNEGRFHIGVMRTDGSEERLLTASFLDEGPTWSPNGRVLMFTRETAGAQGVPALYSVDISGRNLRRVPLVGPASDPAWSPLLP
jgi:TolB protein